MLRKILPISATIFGLAILSGSAHAATASATASATVLTPIAIAKTADMSFGSLYADNVTAGTLVLATDGSRTVTGGVTTGATGGAAASFTVTGTTDAAYVVTLPTTAVTITDGTNNMTVDTFTDNSTGTLTGGSVSFQVGATLNVAAGQVANAYSGSFNVTANYN